MVCFDSIVELQLLKMLEVGIYFLNEDSLHFFFIAQFKERQTYLITFRTLSNLNHIVFNPCEVWFYTN